MTGAPDMNPPVGADAGARLRQFIGRARTELPTPALVLDLDTMRENITTMASWSKRHAAIRPHFKVHKCLEIAREQIGAGAIGMTAATVWEAAALVVGGIDEILIANEVVTPQKVALLAELARDARIIVAVDDASVAARLSKAALEQRSQIEVLIDVDVGMRRGGVRSIEEARELARSLENLEAVAFRGVMGYEGHVVLEPDRKRREALALQAMDHLAQYVEALENDGHPIAIVSAGGTNTYDMTGAHPRVTELQAGTYAVVDAAYARLVPAFRPVLTVVAGVVSRKSGTAILDCGTKALAIDVAPPEPPDGTVREVHEEHTLLDLEDGARLAVGDVVELGVGYSGGTVNLHDAYFVASGEEVVDVWPIVARGAGWTAGFPNERSSVRQAVG